MSTQYDRQIIFKEDSIYWCNYEYDTSLGVTFPTYPLNSNIGATYKGVGQIVKNNPWFVYNKSIYEVASPYMRDERYTRYVSQRIQPLLDALTWTNVCTLDHEQAKEYWLCIDRTVFVYNTDMETWHRFYLADTVTSICLADGKVVIGTTAGQLMEFDGSFTDNGAAIESYIETDWLDYGYPSANKYMDYMWLTMEPEINSSLYVSYAVNYEATEKDTGAINHSASVGAKVARVRVTGTDATLIKACY